MRQRRSESNWRRIVKWQRESGLSVRAFAEEHGLSAATIYGWRRRLARLDDPDFVEVQVTEARELVGPVVFEIEVLGGVVVRVPSGFDSDELRRVLDVVAC